MSAEKGDVWTHGQMDLQCRYRRVGTSPVVLRMPLGGGSQGRGCHVLHKLPQLCAVMHVMSMSYQRVWHHELQCRHLEVWGCSSAASLVSGISALQNLEHLAIDVDNSLGTIGKLRALTWLNTAFRGAGPRYELHLENPKLQSLSVVPYYSPQHTYQVTAQYKELCTSPYYLPCTFQHCHFMGGLLLAGRAHVAVLISLDGAPRATDFIPQVGRHT